MDGYIIVEDTVLWRGIVSDIVFKRFVEILKPQSLRDLKFKKRSLRMLRKRKKLCLNLRSQ